MALVLFDTNIFIDMLNGVHQATLELASYDRPAISAITFLELQAGAIVRPHEQARLDSALKVFDVIQIDEAIIAAAIQIRGNSLRDLPKIALPDAIIGATASVNALPIVTRNPSDFRSTGTPVHVPYAFDSNTGVVSHIAPIFKLK